MRLSITKSKNAKSYYAIKSTFEKGKHSSKIIEKLGTLDDLMKKHAFSTEAEVESWARAYIAALTKREKEESTDIIVKYSPRKQIQKNKQHMYNGGYLFLQKIYKQLGLTKICKTITAKYKFTYDLDSILSRLIYGRVIYPSSKLATSKLSHNFIQPPNFQLVHVYRALEVICKESDFLQSELYKNSLKLMERNTSVLYYDLTNYFFEIEQADCETELRQYGKSKENRPNPIVQMGLFMDAEGIPLSFCIERGNKNEQQTLKPLERKIIKDFELSKFIVCTDAGLSSEANRKYNSQGGRAFVTVQSIKKLKKHLKDWALDSNGWKISGETTEEDITYNIALLDELEESDAKLYAKLKKVTFYKERWINENGFEQRLVVTFSLKYRDYNRHIRAKQLERAQKTIEKGISKLKKVNSNDYRRFIKRTSLTGEGDVAKKDIYNIDNSVAEQESIFDGFYGVCTNLDDPIEDLVRINSRRWEIEESFRIMKSEFKARPVHLSLDERITAHFTTCFVALMIFRLLEKKLGETFTAHEIIDTLRDFNFQKIQNEGYVPLYIRTDLTDALHESFGFRTDFEIVNANTMKKAFLS